MVVASSAADGHTEHHLSCCRNDVVKIVVSGKFPIGGSSVPNTEFVIAGRNDGLCRRSSQFIACQLLLDELMIGFIFVEGVNDVIAVSPDIGLVRVALIAVGLCIPNKVKPMPSPLFAIAWAISGVYQ